MTTKKSNAYIGQGIRDGVHLMKIGKSNDVKRRQRELPITIDRIAVCVSESAAYQFEDDLRRFVTQQGGVRYQKTLDWFEFDERIYSLLLKFFNAPDDADRKELSEEEEIRLYRDRYYQLLRDIIQKLQQTIREKKEEIRQLHKQIDAARQKEWETIQLEHAGYQAKIIELHRKIGRLEAQIEIEETKRTKRM